MICGTSTGGLIAIMLGRLEMSIDDCISAYVTLSNRILTKQRPRMSIKGKVQARFDTAGLQRGIKEIITQTVLDENALLKSENGRCKVVVCAVSRESRDVVHFTSYRSRGSSNLFENTKIWEAARATSAASSFFNPISIGIYSEEFVDGATGAIITLYENYGKKQRSSGLECLLRVSSASCQLEREFHLWSLLDQNSWKLRKP
ncbi:hypothetical protein VTN00DRAFT_8895 [Thermoascus crustaceus]|uniref:uncharacterized protein n=1 Tax=Thermoascus crustaceus TaxID=5088 RepID=UPI00374436C9